jgi:hypothetical protein
VFSTGPPAGGAKGRLTLGRPLGSSCADAELRKGKDNTPIGSHGYCLIVGDDISKKFSMAWGEDDIYVSWKPQDGRGSSVGARITGPHDVRAAAVTSPEQHRMSPAADR